MPCNCERRTLLDTAYESRKPVWYLGEWWHVLSANWACLRWETGPITLTCEFVNFQGHRKKFDFTGEVYVEPCCRHDGSKGYRIVSTPHQCVEKKQFWVVMRRGSPGTCLELLNGEEYVTEEAALAVAEAHALRSGSSSQYFTMKSVARTSVFRVTTVRLDNEG